jgi:hypothetical protein
MPGVAELIRAPQGRGPAAAGPCGSAALLPRPHGPRARSRCPARCAKPCSARAAARRARDQGHWRADQGPEQAWARHSPAHAAASAARHVLPRAAAAAGRRAAPGRLEPDASALGAPGALGEKKRPGYRGSTRYYSRELQGASIVQRALLTSIVNFSSLAAA